MKLQETGGAEPRPDKIERRPRSRRRRGKGLRGILLLAAVFLIGLFVYNGMAVLKFLDKANRNQFTGVGNTVAASPWNGNERVNILFLGVDNRDRDQSPRSDTMLLLSIDPQSKQAALMSIMRDTYVTVPGHGKNKINTAFAIGGPNLAIKTVEEFLRIPVHYFVVTDFKGFEGVIDAIGGVDINVEIPMHHTDDGVYDINLKKGYQHLNGKEALQYVRYRSDARSDFARTERQRKLVKAVLEQLKTPLTAVRFPGMLKEAEPYVQTNMTAADLARISPDLLGLDSKSVKSLQIPPDDLLTETFNYLGESILEPDTEGVRKFVRDHLRQESAAPENSQPASQMPGPRKSPNSAELDPAPEKGVASTPGSSVTSGTAGSNGAGRTARVTSGEGVNVRRGPGTDNPILTSVSPGETVTVLGEQGDWYNVRLKDGTVGYIYGPLLTLNP